MARVCCASEFELHVRGFEQLLQFEHSHRLRASQNAVACQLRFRRGVRVSVVSEICEVRCVRGCVSVTVRLPPLELMTNIHGQVMNDVVHARDADRLGKELLALPLALVAVVVDVPVGHEGADSGLRRVPCRNHGLHCAMEGWDAELRPHVRGECQEAPAHLLERREAGSLQQQSMRGGSTFGGQVRVALAQANRHLRIH